MRVCATCGKTEKQGAKFSVTSKRKLRSGKIREYYRRDCNRCDYERHTKGLQRPRLEPPNKKKDKYAKYRPQKNETMLTTMKQREEDGYKCLAIDVLTLAVLGHKEGATDAGFWNSWNFELFCALADQHPDYIRRGVLGTATR